MNARLFHLPPDAQSPNADDPAIAEYGLDEAGAAWVQLPHRRWPARRALSCLIEPVAGDRVAICRDRDVAWVIAVLARDLDAQASLKLPRRTQIECDDELSFASRNAIALHAARVDVFAHETRLVGESLLSVHRRVDVHADSASRTVVGVDRVDAQVLDQRAQVCATLKSPHVAIEGGDLVKVRGAQIHMG